MKEKVDREMSEMREDLVRMRDIAKKWVENWDNLKKKDVPTMMEVTMRERAECEMDKMDPFYYRKECKREGLAFEIFDIVDQKKSNVRKIYIDGHIEGFGGNPCIVNHIFPKINALKYFAQSINEEYRKFIIRCVSSDFYPIENLNVLYKKFKETIEKI